MQTFRMAQGWRRWAPVAVTAVGGIVLLPWRLEAQLGSGQKPKEAKTVQAGAYTLRIVNPSSSGSFHDSASGGTDNSSFSFNSSGGFASGGVAGGGSFTFGPGGTATSSFHSNLSLGLEISSKSKDELLMVDGVENLHGQDERGKAVRGPDMGSMSMPAMPQMFNLNGAGNPPKDSSRREMLMLQTEDGAKSLKTLEGELLVTNGAVRTVTFAADEVRPGASRRAGQVTITIDSVRETDNGYEVSVTYDSPQPPPSQDMREQMRRMASANRGLQIELIGTDGETYKPMSQGGGSGGGTFFTQSSDGRVSSSGGSSTSKMNLAFSHLPGDAQPKSLVFRTVERLGEPRRIPFKFTDVSLGASK